MGIFGACWHLKRANKLLNEEEKRFLDIEEWFRKELPNPPFYKDGNPDKAVTWFKRNSTKHMIIKLQPLMDLLDQYGVEYDIVFTNYPGKVIYEDEFQIATV